MMALVQGFFTGCNDGGKGRGSRRDRQTGREREGGRRRKKDEELERGGGEEKEKKCRENL